MGQLLEIQAEAGEAMNAEHDESLEPSDDTIAALQAKVVEQRTALGSIDESHLLLTDADSSRALAFAARLVRIYEALKAAGR